MQDRSHWIRLARLTLVALVAGVVLAGGGYYLLADIAYIHALTHPGCGEMGLTPADVGLTAQDVAYSSHDGLTLRAWYRPPQNGAVVILLPGLGGARDGMLQEGAILARHGYGLLMTDLRSCAHPDGQTTLGYYEARDLRRAVDWVLAQPDVAHVGVLGFSMGGVTAILGAAQDTRIEAVVAEGGFYDLVADLTDSDKDVPLLRRLSYSINPWLFCRETGVDPHLISPISVIGQISPRPLFLIYGADEAVSGHAWEQYRAAGEPKSLWIVPDCGHGNYPLVAPEEWEERVVGFFAAQWSPTTSDG